MQSTSNRKEERGGRRVVWKARGKNYNSLQNYKFFPLAFSTLHMSNIPSKVDSIKSNKSTIKRRICVEGILATYTVTMKGP